jgi:hypothetical protein
VNKAELDNHPASTGGAMSAASSAATSASSPVSLQEAAAQAALQALAQLTRGDAKLCAELLSAQVMPALLQLLCSRGCCAAALALIGDLAALPEGRRALHYADGFAALSQVAEVGSDAAAPGCVGRRNVLDGTSVQVLPVHSSADSPCTCSSMLLRGLLLGLQSVRRQSTHSLCAAFCLQACLEQQLCPLLSSCSFVSCLISATPSTYACNPRVCLSCCV